MVPVLCAQSENWTDECFKEQVPVANPNYGKGFLAPEGYKITSRKVKKNRNRIPCNALFRGQKSPLRLHFVLDSVKIDEREETEFYRESNSECQPGLQLLH